MTNNEIKDLCNKLGELITKTKTDGHKQFYYVTKVKQLVKKLEKENK